MLGRGWDTPPTGEPPWLADPETRGEREGAQEATTLEEGVLDLVWEADGG